MTAERPQEEQPEIRNNQEDKLYLEQHFLPAIYTRPEALKTVEEIVERGEYSFEDLFRTMTALTETFHDESDGLDDRVIGTNQEHEHVDFIGNIGVTLYGYSAEQFFGFNQDTEIDYQKRAPEDEYGRTEEVSMLKDEQTIPDDDKTYFEYYSLKRSADGQVKSYKVTHIENLSSDDKEDYSEQEYDMPKHERIMLVKMFQDYLKNAPIGYPDHEVQSAA